jgi:hypothetical protein
VYDSQQRKIIRMIPTTAATVTNIITVAGEKPCSMFAVFAFSQPAKSVQTS